MFEQEKGTVPLKISTIFSTIQAIYGPRCIPSCSLIVVLFCVMLLPPMALDVGWIMLFE